MTELALHCRDVAGLVDDMASHCMPGGMRGFVADVGYCADLLPFLIDYQWCESAIAVAYCQRRKEEGG